MIDSSNDGPDVLREFLAAEKAVPDPSPEVGQRVLERLSATLALPAAPPADLPGPTAAPAVPPAATASLGRTVLGLSRRGLLTFVVGAAVGAGGYGAVEHLRQPAVTAIPAPVLPLPAPVPAPAEPVPVPLAAPPETAPAVAPPSTATSGHEPRPGTGRDRGLAAERKLIEMARTSLVRGQTDAALAQLRRHARSYARGQLAEERESLLVQALVAKGDHAQARQRAARFQHDYPTSLFLPVVNQAIRSIP